MTGNPNHDNKGRFSSNQLYQNSKEVKAKLEEQVSLASKQLNEIRDKLGGSVNVGSIKGLTPDHIKSHPDYRQAKLDSERKFAQLQKHNQYHLKTFAKEVKAERKERGR